jgi:phage FluMu protein gp41
MLNGDDQATFYALRQLRDVVESREKPIIIWVGAGVSKWCRFPTWDETAEHLHRAYIKLEHQYDKNKGQALISEGKLPEAFEIFRQVNQTRYNRKLAYLFGPKGLTPVYSRFLSIIRHITPLQIVTTNIDETLEKRLPEAMTVQRSDLERCIELVGSQSCFVAKLHGSISSVESLVFSTRDYQQIQTDAIYLKALETLFARAAVVFIGYSLRDQYVLDLFAATSQTRTLFGDGPHFLVCSSEPNGLPTSIKAIRYTPEAYADHRSAILALDIIRVVKEGPHISFPPEAKPQPAQNRFQSAYFISDVTPPGTWTSSQSLELARKDGVKTNAVVGQGFIDSELPDRTSQAMHDLTVGLVSFDHLFVPLSCAANLHDLLGSATFWNVVTAGILRFIYFENEPVMMYESLDAVNGGEIGVCHLSDENGAPLTVAKQIRRQLRAIPGRESEAEPMFKALEDRTCIFDQQRFHLPSLTRGALLHPSVRNLLGISDAVLPTSMPRWSCFPVLRLAHAIMFGCACENFDLPAAKVGFGSEILVGAAFSVSAARDWADTVSSYVLTSRFDADLGSYLQSDPSILTALLKFRDTAAGTALRSEILDELATNEGSEFVASVNAGLRQIIPNTIMQKAHDQLSGLLLRRHMGTGLVPAVWTNLRNSDETARLWRARSMRELQQVCRSRRIGHDGLCPCGSGEKLRFCCEQALTH